MRIFPTLKQGLEMFRVDGTEDIVSTFRHVKANDWEMSTGSFMNSLIESVMHMQWEHRMAVTLYFLGEGHQEEGVEEVMDEWGLKDNPGFFGGKVEMEN